MTKQDKPAFDIAFNLLAKCGMIHDDDTATKLSYFATLSDLPLWAVELAGAQLQRRPVKFFTCAVWYNTAAQLLQEQRRRDAASTPRHLTASVHCDRCRDTGMRESETDPGRVTHCECRETNPNYQAARAHELAASAAQAEVDAGAVSHDESRRLVASVRDFKKLGSGE